MRRRNRDISIFTMSALDLFASALGAFILLTIVIFPYFPNVSRVETAPAPAPQPPDLDLEERLDEVQAQLAEARRQLAEEREGASGAEELREQLADVEEQLAAAEEQLEEVGAGATAVEEEIRRRLAEAEERLARAEADAREVEGIRRRLAEAEERDATQFPHLDLVIALDVTGSMRNQIADLKTELDQLTRLLISLTPSLGVGIAAFGDRYWERTVTTLDLREISASPADRAELRRFGNGLEAHMGRGSGSYGSPDDAEEAFLAAMRTAARMSWRTQAEQRVIVLITDNPAYPEDVNAAIAEARSFAARGDGYRVSTVFVRTGSSLTSTAAFLERVAAAGDGQFVEARGSFTAMLLLSLI